MRWFSHNHRRRFDPFGSLSPRGETRTQLALKRQSRESTIGESRSLRTGSDGCTAKRPGKCGASVDGCTLSFPSDDKRPGSNPGLCLFSKDREKEVSKMDVVSKRIDTLFEVSLLYGRDTYAFRFHAVLAPAMLRHFARLAANPTHPLGWYEIAMLSRAVRELTGEQPLETLP